MHHLDRYPAAHGSRRATFRGGDAGRGAAAAGSPPGAPALGAPDPEGSPTGSRRQGSQPGGVARPWGPRMGPGREGPPGERASIEIGGDQVGVVLVAGRNPRTAVFLREFAPTQGVIGVILLVLGSAVASLAIFRPAHRRLNVLGADRLAPAFSGVPAAAAQRGGTGS